jgi:hypothetical protein
VPDFSDKYNTPLSPEDEAAFQSWAAKNGNSKDLFNYDLRGDWLAGAKRDGRNHGSDDFKKPNHSTFSDGSIYNGKDGYEGGQWTGDDAKGWDYQASKTNLQFLNRDGMKDYFRRVEPGSKVRFPAPSSGGPVMQIANQGIGLGR